MIDHIKPKMSYSYDGADLICANILRDVAGGTYIDIGANHPVDMNNTNYFYNLGWRGLAIDGNDEFQNLWSIYRPEDIFNSALVSNTNKEVQFTKYEDHTMSTIDPTSENRYSQRSNNVCIEREFRQSVTLFELKQEYLLNQEVHFLSVDVEGEDLNCLIGARLDLWQPGLILVETKQASPYNLLDNDIVQFLTGLGFRMIAKTPLDAYFVYPDKPYLQWIPNSIIEL
jgi:hypothetical protein